MRTLRNGAPRSIGCRRSRTPCWCRGTGRSTGDGGAIAQTRDWLGWLETALTQAVADGLDMTEAGELPIPDRFAGLKAARYELQRSVSHLYPGIEARLLPQL